MMTERLDLTRLRAEGLAPAPRIVRDRPSARADDRGRAHQLADLRSRLLDLHKVLLDDARVAYELDRGRVGSVGNLLQLVISDPWFAWLHALSELIVRIDETVERDGRRRSAPTPARSSIRSSGC